MVAINGLLELKDIETLLSAGGWLLLLSLTAIQKVAPAGKKPWTAIAKMLGAEINREVIATQGKLSDQIESVRGEIKSVKHEVGEDRAITARVRILIFADELLEGRRHSKDRFDQVLVDIDNYEKYCAAHPEFKNNQTCSTVAHIRKKYCERLEKRDFL